MSVYKNLYVRENLEAKTSNISNDLTVSQNASISGSLNVGGDLVVSGTTTSIDTTNLNVVDKYVYLNSGYTADAAAKSGLVVNYDPSATTTSVATGGFTTTTTVHVTNASSFVANDIIQISGTNNAENTGIFVIDGDPTANVITIKTGVDFAQSAFVVDTTVAGVVHKVAVSILRTTTTGDWEITKGDNDASLTTVGVATTSGGGDVSFNTVTAEAASNQLVLGTTNTATITSTQSAASTFTIPDVTGNDTFVMLGATQTLTNKTLTSPVISSIVNTGTLSLPTDDTTLVGIDTFDTLTNKTLTAPVISSPEISLEVVPHTTTSPLAAALGAINTFTPGAANTATLPDATAFPGKTYKFILLSGPGSVTITPAIGQSIEGVVNGTHVLDAPQQHCSVTSDGASWYINL